jgi:hypothetical protein
MFFETAVAFDSVAILFDTCWRFPLARLVQNQAVEF